MTGNEMQTGKETHWNKVFNQRDEENLTWFQKDTEPSLGLIGEFAPHANSPIIDVGAGASRLADHLLEGGFSDLTLLDISGEALDKTLARLGENADSVGKIVTDITRWTPPRTWQVWHDRAVFHFLTSPQDQNAYLGALEAATRPGATIIMGTFDLKGPEKCSGLPVQRYSPETLAARLGAQFTLIRGLAHTHITPTGNEQKFSFAVFRKN